MTKSLQERIDALVAKGVAISQQRSQSLASEQQNKIQDAVVLHFPPACSENTRVTPNSLLRGALFGLVSKGNRRFEDNVLKATISGITVKFTGKQLDQADLDVWLECIHRCKKYGFGKPVHFSAHGFLKSIGRNTGKSDHEWLKASLLRLKVCNLELGDGRFFYDGNLLDEKYRDEHTGEHVIALNQKIAVFFASKLWTGLLLEQRTKLKGKPLAQWLHGFYSTHDKPFSYKVDTLMKLCGSENSELRKFKYKLKKSLSDLSIATGWQCSIDENDLVQLKKKEF